MIPWKPLVIGGVMVIVLFSVEKTDFLFGFTLGAGTMLSYLLGKKDGIEERD